MHIAETCTNHNIFKSLDRLLNIWEQRAVYETEQIQLFRTNLNQNIDSVLEEHDRKRKLAAAENGGPSKKSKSSAHKESASAPVKDNENMVNGANDHTLPGTYKFLVMIYDLIRLCSLILFYS